jgi:hypothetical protein
MRTGRDEQEAWGEFRGKPNTEAMLRQKASIVSRLVDSALDTALLASQTSKEDTEGIKQSLPDITAERNVMAETAALLLHVADEVATKCLPVQSRDIFIDALEQFVGENLRERGLPQRDFADLLGPSYAEYAYYNKWVIAGDQSAKGTLFWEYAKKIAFLTGVGKNELFNASLIHLLTKRLYRWNLLGLIRG